MDLKQRRKAKGWSQQELARRCRCFHSYISKIENSKWEPDQKLLAVIEAVLDGQAVVIRQRVSFSDAEEAEDLGRIWRDNYAPLRDKLKEKVMKHDCCRYYEDGTVDVAISPDGLPEMTALLPAPFMDEVRRHKMVEDAINNLYLKGYFLVSSIRVKNTAFDKGEEKTTTELVYRLCKNADEARLVGDKIKGVVEGIFDEGSG